MKNDADALYNNNGAPIDNVKDLHGHLKPFGDLPITFHWADSSKLTRSMQSSLKLDNSLQVTLQQLEYKFHELQQIMLWVKNHDSIIPMSLYDVYMTMMAHLKKGEFEDQLFNSQELSFIGPTGPYKFSTMVELLNKSTFNEFVFYSILKNKLPHRGFRLHTQGQVMMQFGQHLDQVTMLKIQQITDNGVLFASRDELLLDNMTKGEVCKFMLDTTAISRLLDGHYPEDPGQDLFFTSNDLRYFVVKQTDIIKSLGYDSAITGEFYLFIRYSHMHDSELPVVFKTFIQTVKKNILQAA
jgi:hypothetical protein